MKAENVDVLVRDLIESLGLGNRPGVPLHLLIAEAKAFAKQSADDQHRYVAGLEENYKSVSDHLEAVQKDREGQAERIKDLESQCRHTVEALNEGKMNGRSVKGALYHSQLMWEAERVLLESQAHFWKGVAADLIADNSMGERVSINGYEFDFFNVLRRRRDATEDGPERDRLDKILAPFEKPKKA